MRPPSTASFREIPYALLTHLPQDIMAAILADDNSKCISFNENDRIQIQVSLIFVPRSRSDYKPALVQVMSWRRTGDKPLPKLLLAQFIEATLGGDEL